MAPIFVPAHICATLVREIDELRAQGQMRPAGVGRGTELQVRSDVRADLIAWLEPDELTAAQKVVWEALEQLRIALNRRLYLGLRGVECHLTVYPAGAFYQRHIDNFRGLSKRVVSCVLYLNADWREEDGGELVLFQADAEDTVAGKVLPEAGTLACFISADLPHEVRPNRRERYSVTAWFLRE